MAKYLENLRSKDLVIENLWIGTSVEDQQTADERIPILLSIPGYKKFISVEPMLGPIDLSRWICRGHRGCEDWGICHGKEKNDCIYNALPYEGLLDWVICGAETGPGARMTDLSWARMLKEQCTAAGVPFFFKSAGRRIEIPDDLKTREYPIMGAKNDPGPR